MTARGWTLVLNGQAVTPTSLSLSPLPATAQLSRQEPTRTCCPPLSTRGPDGSCTARCLGGSSSSSSHTNPRSMARSPCTVATGSKVSVHSASGAGSGWGALASADLQGTASAGPPVETRGPGRAEWGFEWSLQCDLSDLMSIRRVGSCPSGMGVHCRDGRGGASEASTGSSFPLPGLQEWVVWGLG